MLIYLISIGTKPPEWVQIGYQDYCARLPPKEYSLKLIEIPAPKRTKGSNIPKLIEQEGALILKALPAHTHIIALDRKGKHMDTLTLAEKLTLWSQHSQSISFVIGGPDGLSSQIVEKSHETWSLSALTFPHALVRVILAEQIYRAWSIMTHHPYHR